MGTDVIEPNVGLVGSPDLPSRRPRRILGYLDGIRALAALWVLAGHAVRFLPANFMQPATGWHAEVLTWLGVPHIAVDVFIVLSGFCLGLPIGDRGGQLVGGAINFYKRRSRRILPPLYIVLALSAALGFIGMRAALGVTGNFSPKFLLCNALLLQDFVGKYNTLDSAVWSVALEYKIYLFLPLFVWIMRRKLGLVWMVATSALIGFGVSAVMHVLKPADLQFHTCPWFLVLFALGVVGSQFSAEDKKPAATPWGILTIAAAMVTAITIHLLPIGVAGDGDHKFQAHAPVIDIAVGCLTMCLLTYLAQLTKSDTKSRLLAFFGAAPLVFIGGFSYSIYLVHQVVIRIEYRVLTRLTHGHFAGSIPVYILSMLVALGLAYPFFLLFERPFINIKTRKDLHFAQAPVELDVPDGTVAAGNGASV